MKDGNGAQSLPGGLPGIAAGQATLQPAQGAIRQKIHGRLRKVIHGRIGSVFGS